MPTTKYNTEEERHDAKKQSMRKYAKYRYDTNRTHREQKKKYARERYYNIKNLD